MFVDNCFKIRLQFACLFKLSVVCFLANYNINESQQTADWQSRSTNSWLHVCFEESHSQYYPSIKQLSWKFKNLSFQVIPPI